MSPALQLHPPDDQAPSAAEANAPPYACDPSLCTTGDLTHDLLHEGLRMLRQVLPDAFGQPGTLPGFSLN